MHLHSLKNRILLNFIRILISLILNEKSLKMKYLSLQMGYFFFLAKIVMKMERDVARDVEQNFT